MDTASHNIAMPPSRRRPGMFSSGLLIALLALEVWLFACDRFGWCGFATRKGWAVLIATGSASVLLTVFIGWFLICLLAGRCRQFSLSSLLLLMLAVAIPLGWLTSSVQRANRQHEAIAKLESDYASVQFARDSKWSNVSQYSPPPAFLERALNREFFEDVVALSMGDGAVVHPVSDTELAYLRDFDQLRSLEIWFVDGYVSAEDVQVQGTSAIGPRISNAGLGNLKQLVTLEELTLGNSWQVTDSGLANNAGLERLEKLKLSQLSSVTDAGLASIGGLTNLRFLSVSLPDNDPLGAEATENFAELTRLETLLLDGTNITDGGMQHIGHLTQLRNLSLRGADLTDASMSQVANLKQLEYLVLGGTVITDAGVARLVGLTRLKCLNLKDTNISDASVPSLASLPNLTFLYVSGTNITQAGRAQLRELNPSLLIMSPFAGEDPLSVR